MIASGRILAVSALTASASSAFTTTPSAPFSRSIFIPASLLVIPITSCLAATSAATSGLPMAPLAPATSTFIGFNLPLTTEAQRLAPSLPLRRQDHLYEPIGIEIGLRGLVDLGAGQHLDAVRQIGDSGEIRGIAVFISAGDLVQEVAVVLAVPLEIAQQVLVDDCHLRCRQRSGLEGRNLVEHAAYQRAGLSRIACPVDSHGILRPRKLLDAR